MLFNNITNEVGRTPLVNLKSDDLSNIILYAKLEYYNPTGSMKDRAASYVIKKLLEKNIIDKETTLIESSSGNFGIALSVYSREADLKFYCVVDPKISPINEFLIKMLSTKMIKVNKPDNAGGYLLTRIEKVKELCSLIPNSYWINQYCNPLNAEAYCNTLGVEICDELDDIDYIFIGVSSGGTITGVSRKIKERFKRAKVVAVDIAGSVIFGGQPEKRNIPGIGSSMVPEILKMAHIDDIVIVDEASTIKMCHELLKNHSIFAGGSSGSVFAAIKKYFNNKKLNRTPKVVAIFPDRGERYANTIFSQQWYKKHIN